MAIPYYSTDRPSDTPQVRFLEVPAGNGAAAANALKIWFYPGNTVGHEFVWPRDKAMALARATNQSVLTTKTASEDSELSRVSGDGIDAVVADPEASAEPASTAQVAQAERSAPREPVGAMSGADAARAPAAERAAAPMQERNDAAAPATTARTPATTRTDLPNTAGLLPLLALIGLGSLAASRLMRRARR